MQAQKSIQLFSVFGLLILGLLLGMSCAPDCAGYSVLTHEAIIDAAWKNGIKPLLLSRFPNATQKELLQAHAYAYGGAIIQDLGYYPFGSRFFSDLTHYVRSGDFVLALMSSVFGSVDLAIGSYRHAGSTVIPDMTKIAWHLKKDELKQSHPSETKSEFIYNVSGSAYRKEWGHIYETPGFFARLKALVLRAVPKVGPFSGLAFHPPTPAAEQLYMQSFNDAL